MRLRELTEGINPKLFMVLRQLQNDGTQKINIQDLNDMLAGMGVEAFSYETFAASYNIDPRLKKLIKNFNKDEIYFVQDATDGIPQAGAQGDVVGQMAKRATDLTDLS